MGSGGGRPDDDGPDSSSDSTLPSIYLFVLHGHGLGVSVSEAKQVRVEITQSIAPIQEGSMAHWFWLGVLGSSSSSSSEPLTCNMVLESKALE